MATLKEISQEMGNLVATADPAIVRVEARRRFPASGLVWSGDGLIVTASHVVRRDSDIMIGFGNGQKMGAELLGRDASTDLALLKVEAAELTTFALSDTEDIRVGNLVLALARPGVSTQATVGIISALGLKWHGSRSEGAIQTDVLMYPGFSGGPLLSAGGTLVGLNTSALLRGVSVAVPVATIARVVSALREHGHVRRGYLGVSTQVVRLQEKIAAHLGQKSGLLVVAVESGSPAEAGGLTIGDTIVRLGESIIRQHDDLMSELVSADFEQKTPLMIVRGGEVQELNVKIGSSE